jgi:putative peptidoglycan lipid II flippase
VVGQAIATAALPVLSRLWSEGRREELDRGVLDALRAGLGLAVLAAAAFTVFAEPIVALIIQTGRFTAADTARVATLLGIFAWAVPAWITQQIAVRAFYARGQMWRPMLLGTAVALAAVPLYLVLGRRFGGEGLAAAGVIGMSVNALLTLGLARVLHGGPSLLRLAAMGARAVLIALAAAACGAWAMPGGQGAVGALLDLVVGGTLFTIVAIPGAWLLGGQAMREALNRVLRRLRTGRG